MIRYSIPLLGLMFGLVSFAVPCQSTPAAGEPADRLTLQIEAGDRDGVYFPDEDKHLIVRVRSDDRVASTFTLELRLTLDDGETRHYTQDVELPASGETRTEFKLDLSEPCFADCAVSVAGRSETTRGTLAVVRPPQLDDLPFDQAFYGVHIMARPETARRVGIRFVRSLIYWRWTEKQPGGYDFSGQVRDTRDFLASNIGYIWTFEPRPPDWVGVEHMVFLNRPEPLKRFAEWVEAGIKALPRERLAVEFNNEPDITMGRTSLVDEAGAARAAADLLKTGYDVAKRIDPDLPVLGGGGSGEASRTHGFAHKLLEGADGKLDYYSTHFYTHSRYIKPDGSVIWPDQYMDVMLEQNAPLAVEFTQRKAIWSTEVGWAYPMDEVYLSPATKDFAAITAQELVLFKTVPHVGKITLFRGYQYKPGLNERGYDYSLFVQNGDGGIRPTTGVNAFATVSSLLEGSETGRKLDLGPALRAYLFENHLTGRIITTLWTTRYDVSAKAPPPEGVTVIDHYGREHPGNAWKLTRAPTFLVAPLEQRAVLENYLKKTQWRPEQAFVISNIGFHGADQWNVSVESLLIEPVKADIRYGDRTGPATLNPSYTQVLLPADNRDLSGPSVDLAVSVSGGDAETTARFTKPLFAVPYLTDADKLLSRPAPVQVSPVATNVLDDRQYLWPPDPAIPWDGPEDLGVRYGYAWNERGLYAIYQVRDDRQVGAKEHDFWNYDSIQIGLDPMTKGGKSGYQPSQRELGFYLKADGRSQLVQSYPARTEPPEIPSRATAVKGGVVYELFFPWTYLLGRGDAPPAGSILAANFIVNDNDGSGRDCWMSLGDGIGAGKSPAVYPWLRLQPKTPAR